MTVIDERLDLLYLEQKTGSYIPLTVGLFIHRKDILRVNLNKGSCPETKEKYWGVDVICA